MLAVGFGEIKQKGDNEGGYFKILPSQRNKIFFYYNKLFIYFKSFNTIFFEPELFTGNLK